MAEEPSGYVLRTPLDFIEVYVWLARHRHQRAHRIHVFSKYDDWFGGLDMLRELDPCIPRHFRITVRDTSKWAFARKHEDEKGGVLDLYADGKLVLTFCHQILKALTLQTMPVGSVVYVVLA